MSVKKRFIVSLFTSVLRAVVSFATGLVVARGLSPTGYGDITFLLGSFAAIRALLDMGSSSAFYTFIAQYQRSIKFYLFYYCWLALQFLITLLLVTVILPAKMIDTIWLGHSTSIVVLALCASFMQQSVWTTVIQIGESSRNTIKIQFANLAVMIAHLIIVSIMYIQGWLSVFNVLGVLVIEYILATVFSVWLLKASKTEVTLRNFQPNEMLLEYWRFCKPLIAMSVVAFAYQFLDRWFLQKFGGAEQQGYYQISAQFAAVSLLVTSSVTHIFWKEMAEASGKQDKQRMAYLYNRASRGLLMVAAVIACFLMPWAQQIVKVLLGASYADAWPVLALMFFYPIHQSMGQVNATMFMASDQTKVYTIIGVWGMAVSIPATYFLLAPAHGMFISGLDLGALGLAIKMIGESVIFVNIQTWKIACVNGWRYEWKYQVIGIMSLLCLGYLVKALLCLLMPMSCYSTDKQTFLLAIFSAGLVYAIGVIAFFWFWPSIAGFERQEMRHLMIKVNSTLHRISG